MKEHVSVKPEKHLAAKWVLAGIGIVVLLAGALWAAVSQRGNLQRNYAADVQEQEQQHVVQENEMATSAHLIATTTSYLPDGKTSTHVSEEWHKIPDKSKLEAKTFFTITNGNKFIRYDKDKKSFVRHDLEEGQGNKFTDEVFTAAHWTNSIESFGATFTINNVTARYKNVEYPSFDIQSSPVTLADGHKMGSWHMTAYLVDEKRQYLQAIEIDRFDPDGKRIAVKETIEYEYIDIEDEFFDFQPPAGAIEVPYFQRPEDAVADNCWDHDH